MYIAAYIVLLVIAVAAVGVYIQVAAKVHRDGEDSTENPG